jgi:hypothetical protein
MPKGLLKNSLVFCREKRRIDLNLIADDLLSKARELMSEAH